jgi:hypothetical protein
MRVLFTGRRLGPLVAASAMSGGLVVRLDPGGLYSGGAKNQRAGVNLRPALTLAFVPVFLSAKAAYAVQPGRHQGRIVGENAVLREIVAKRRT